MARDKARLRIGVIFIQNALGECVIGFESFYAIKAIYDCELIVFAKPTMQNLLRHCEFVDEVRECTKEDIDAVRCDYVILSNAKTIFINFALSTNARKIICATKFRSLFSLRCRTVPIYMGKRYYHYDERQILLAYTRAIDPRRYDERIGNIDLANAKIACGSEYEEKAQKFLAAELAKRVKLDSSRDVSKDSGKNPARYLVMINPFNNACPYSLSLHGFLRLIDRVASRHDCIPLVITFEKVHARFVEVLAQYCSKRYCGGSQITAKIATSQAEQTSTNNIAPPPISFLNSTALDSSPESTPIDSTPLQKLIVYQNTDEILMLGALISQSSVVISPSTGALHFALNERIPTIAIYPRYDTRRWATHNKRYVFVETRMDSITLAEEERIIEECMNTLADMINQGELARIQAF